MTLATESAGAAEPSEPGRGSAAAQTREGGWSSRKPTSRSPPCRNPPMEHRCGAGHDSASPSASSAPAPGTAVAPSQALPDSATTNGCTLVPAR